MGTILTGTHNVKCFVGDVPLDAKVSETFTATSTVTKHPVEDGSDIADHVTDEPDGLQIEGIISDTPAYAANAFAAARTRAEDAFDDLLALKEARAPITVITIPRDYENMVLTKVARNQNAQSGDAVHVSLALEAMRTVESASVAAPQRPAGVQKKTTKLGKKPTTEATEAQKISILKKTIAWLGT